MARPKDTERLTHCKYCGEPLGKYKILFCTSACQSRFKYGVKKIYVHYPQVVKKT